MGLKSREKGKRGEREAVLFLKELGFADAKRTQQHNGIGLSDVICPESLPHVHFEVKYGYDRTAFDVGGDRLCEACMQAAIESDGNPWIVLWRPKGCTTWRGTMLRDEMHVTVADVEIGTALRHWLTE